MPTSIVRPLIYVAGPYTNPDPVLNTRRAVQTALWLREHFDVGVIIPHVTLLAHAIEPRDIDYWYDYDLDQLRWCHGLYRFEGASTGADNEVRFALEHKIPVFVEAGGEPITAWLERTARLAEWQWRGR